jgi:hypothetical protein
MEAFKKYPLTVQIVLALMILLSAVVLLSNCSRRSGKDKEIGKVKTKSIAFKCDQHINQGLLLPVDIIYLTTYRMPREITSIGPDKWFNSSERDNWVERQSLSLKGGETKKLKLNKLWLKNTKLLFVIADFKGVNEPYSQQLVIDRSARKKEKILVLPRALTFDR